MPDRKLVSLHVAVYVESDDDAADALRQVTNAVSGREVYRAWIVPEPERPSCPTCGRDAADPEGTPGCAPCDRRLAL